MKILYCIIYKYCTILYINNLHYIYKYCIILYIMYYIIYINTLLYFIYKYCTVVTRMTGLLFTSERSHYFRKSYLEERGLTSTKSYADRLTKIRPKIP